VDSRDLAAAAATERGPVGVLLVNAAVTLPVGASRLDLGRDPAQYGRSLYAALHTCDELGVTTILVEAPPRGPAWDAVHDRLRRASHPAERPTSARSSVSAGDDADPEAPG
jgi:hypothetical protein